MKLWKAAFVLLAIAVVAAGYGTFLVRRGFSARGTPSAIAEQGGMQSNLNSPRVRSKRG